MASHRERKELKLAELKEKLANLKAAYSRALAAQTWETRDGVNTRSVANADVSALFKQIRQTEAEIETIESLLDDGFRGFGLRIGGKF